MLLDHLMVLQDPEERDGPDQMALDEALLKLRAVPVIRFYRWKQRQITFGYFGNYEQIARQYPELLLTRRWTGGGIVEHGGDITFSMIFPSSHATSAWRGAAIYAAIHAAVAGLLAGAGEDVFLAGNPAQEKPGAHCFTSAAVGDVLSAAGKLAGGALRRTKAGVLYQGSIQGPGISHSSGLQERVRRELPAYLGSSTTSSPIGSSETRLAEEIRECRYSSQEWLLGKRRG